LLKPAAVDTLRGADGAVVWPLVPGSSFGALVPDGKIIGGAFFLFSF
jgi:hypothetical protein